MDYVYYQIAITLRYCRIPMSIKSVLIGIIITIFLLSMVILMLMKQTFVSKLQFQGQDIDIKRTANNIPQIRAPSYKSALYAWGYVTAEDRLFQLAFRRQLIKGQLSQYLGNKSVDIDKMFRQIDLHGWSLKTAQRFKRENLTEYQNFQAYARGINDYFKTLTFRPVEFHAIGLGWTEWTVADAFCMYKLLKWSLSFGMVEEYVRSSLLHKYTKQQLDKFLPYQSMYWLKGQHATQKTIVKDEQIPVSILQRIKGINFETFTPIPVQQMLQVGFYEYLDVNQRASNSWVIGGNLTQSGHALLCNDPHLDSSLPAEYHQVRIFYPNRIGEEVYIIGAGLVGLPIVIGKTSYVSTTLTTNYMDSQDLFKETIEGNRYLLDGQWRQLKIRKQIIKVKGQVDIQYSIYETHRGPLLKHMGYKGYLYKIQEPMSLCWIGFTDAEHISLSAYGRLAEVQNFEQLQHIMVNETDYGPPMNLVFSTRDDHIGYIAVGMVPLRRHHHAGMYVKDGSKSENDWIGAIQGKAKLHLIDPQRGYIVTANNKAASAKYYHGTFDTSIYTGRADRIEFLIQKQIKQGRKLNKDTMKKIQLDTVDVYCMEVVKGMKQKIETGQPTYKFVYSVFDKFACNFASQSTTSPFWLVFLQNLYEELHPQKQHYSRLILSNFHSFYQYMYNFLLKSHHTHEQLLMLNNSMLDTSKQLWQYYETSDILAYKYGELHQDHMIHRPFSFSDVLKRFYENTAPGWGNMNTVNVGAMFRFHQKDYRTNHRANLRVIMSYYQDSQWIIDGGSSQKFYSYHYKDQLQLYLKGQYLIMDPWNRTNSVH